MGWAAIANGLGDVDEQRRVIAGELVDDAEVIEARQSPFADVRPGGTEQCILAAELGELGAADNRREIAM